MAENFLTIENLSKSFGEKILFNDLSFGINKGQKIALVAKNGAGKTTLLNIIMGKDIADSGNLSFRNDIHYLYLEQNPFFNDESSVLEIIFSSDNPVTKLISDYEDILQKIKSYPNNEILKDKLSNAMAEMDRLNAWDYEAKAKEILFKLNITDLTKKVGKLSGGERKKVALSKVLMQDCDFLILDEPTNHLDIEMIEWLEGFLSKTSLTLFIVTHDRYFIDNVCNEIYELDNGKIFKYKGDYNYFIEKKEEREEILRQEIEKAKSLYKKELEWIRRMPKARGTKSKARIDSFYDIKDKTMQKIDSKPKELSVKTQRLGSKILELSNISMEFDSKKILLDFSYTFKKGEKIGIVGSNGVGKSTFLNIITEKLRPQRGKVTIGQTIQYGYYTQEGLEEKDSLRVIDIIKDVAENIKLDNGTELSASVFLTYFGFSPELQYNYYGNLSGGEKRRLHLLKVLIANPNFLILDEPTNDLDIYNLAILENFLLEYEGCLLIVSHDRSFVDNLVEHLFIFEGDGKIRDYHSTYSDYMKEKEDKKNQKNKETKSENIKINEQKQKTPKARKLSYKEEMELEDIELSLPKLEKERDEITAKLSLGTLPIAEIESLSIRIEEVLKEIETREERWVELLDILS